MAASLERGVARHRIEWVEGGAQMRIPMRRGRWAPLATAAALVLALLEGSRQLDEGWLDGIGFIFLALSGFVALGLFGGLLSQLFGTETLRVAGGNLEVRIGIGPLVRTWRYRGAEIERLMGWNGPSKQDRFVFTRPRDGAVKFEYEGKTIYLAPGVDEFEGAEIAAWLALRLPRRSTVFE